MNSNSCPQCKNQVNDSKNRLIQDSCGHKKCRLCLLQEEAGCKVCSEETEVIENMPKCNISVIKYDIKYSEIPSNTEEKYIDKDNLIISKADILVDNKNNNTEISKDYEVYKNIAHVVVLTKTPLLYKCTICSKTFSTATSVKYHSYCGGLEKPLKCEICKKSFISHSHFEIHKLKHSGIRPFNCTYCQKSFLQKSKLNRHMKLHTGDRPFVCTECGKNFTNKDALTGHIRIHSGDKPFCCIHCGKRFNNKSNLSKHIATHLKEKLYMCEECGKKFGNKWTLASHRKCHTFERPHECQKCSKTFSNMKDLRRHSLIHLDVKPYGCNICNLKFCRKDNLERHLKNTHSLKDSKKIRTAINKTSIKKNSTKSVTTINKIIDIEEVSPKLISSEIEENGSFKEKPNAINVIKMSSEAQIQSSNPIDSKSSNKNAVPVINGPFKLAFKTDAFKNNYNILKRRYSTDPPPRIQTKKHDMVESLNICQKIFNPLSEPTAKCENPIDSVKTVHAAKNVIMSVGKVNEKDSLEICKKIFAPNDIPPLHYETSFEHKKHAVIKNIKFKLPSTYTNSAIKINSENDLSEVNIEQKKLMTNCHIENNEAKYTELQPVEINVNHIDILCRANSKKSVIVNPLSSDIVQKEHFSNLHWRRRTSQNFQPKLINNLL